MKDWLYNVRERLTAAGFVPIEGVEFEGRRFPLVARRTRFEITKFGFSENFFTFQEFDTLSVDDMKSFSAAAFRCANKHRKVPLPRGLGESVWSYAVAYALNPDPRLLEFVRSETPPKHWAAAEIPVVYEPALRKLTFFEKTPLWGAAYYAGFRKQIQRVLAG